MMALEFKLELEGNPPDWSAVEYALKETGVDDLMPLPLGPLDATFTQSGTYITRFQWSDGPRGWVSAEGRHGCKFVVAGGLTFRINNSKYDESVEDIKTFLSHLVKRSSMQFVLSFQGEGVYALRCGSGFEWFWDNPREIGC